jgi:hypothetical protein
MKTAAPNTIPISPCGAYRLAIHHEWRQDVDDCITAPDRSGHWFYIDRWKNWVCWRRLALEPAS